MQPKLDPGARCNKLEIQRLPLLWVYLYHVLLLHNIMLFYTSQERVVTMFDDLSRVLNKWFLKVNMDKPKIMSNVRVTPHL